MYSPKDTGMCVCLIPGVAPGPHIFSIGEKIMYRIEYEKDAKVFRVVDRDGIVQYAPNGMSVFGNKVLAQAFVVLISPEGWKPCEED